MMPPLQSVPRDIIFRKGMVPSPLPRTYGYFPLITEFGHRVPGGYVLPILAFPISERDPYGFPFHGYPVSLHLPIP